MEKKIEFINLLNELIVNNEVDKRVLAYRIYEYIKECEFNPNMDQETREITGRLLVEDIENFVEHKDNPAYIDNLKIQLVHFPKYIIN
jgi:hypothetical protein